MKRVLSAMSLYFPGIYNWDIQARQLCREYGKLFVQFLSQVREGFNQNAAAASVLGSCPSNPQVRNNCGNCNPSLPRSFQNFFTEAVCGALRKGCAARYRWRAIPIPLLHLASGCAADKNLIANFWCLMDHQSAVLCTVVNMNTSFEESENENSAETRIFWKAVREIKL